ncbi:hypothetical protein IW152_003495 [Coemansia sp. BCRC 34962]|nr:hypothetical protein IW152_003495 [Coemansia sp. BCRC 34962]
MDDVAALSATATAAADAATDDFGLIDYESPGPEPLPDIEEAEDPEHSSAADDLIDYAETEDDGPDAAIVAPTPAYDMDGPRMGFDEGTERLEQSLLDSHLSSASEREPSIPAVELDDDDNDDDDDDDNEVLVGEAEAAAETEAAMVAEADMAAEADLVAEAVMYSEQQHALDDTDVPETWVFSDGEWMIYLGPNQHSYGADYQSMLFAMPLDQLISALHADILLREDTELALEFPLLALTIDQRDGECANISLSQIYNCHAAAVRLGRLSEDLVNSPYFSLSSSHTALSFAPPPASFAFIIHTRPSVHSSLKRIMQIVAEDAQASSHPVPVPQEEPKAVASGAVPVPVVSTDTEQANGIALVDLEEAADEPEATTADLLADADEEDDDDEDYVAEGEEEEEGDFVLEEDDEEEADENDDDDKDNSDLVEAEDDGVAEVGGEDAVEEDEDDVADVEGNETRVESTNASPTHKRTQDSIVEAVPDCDAPAAKKSRSEEGIVQGGEDAAAQL